MKATRFAEMSIGFQRGTRRYIADDKTLVETYIKEGVITIGLAERNSMDAVLQCLNCPLCELTLTCGRPHIPAPQLRYSLATAGRNKAPNFEDNNNSYRCTAR
jgi:hypothetical protein